MTQDERNQDPRPNEPIGEAQPAPEAERPEEEQPGDEFETAPSGAQPADEPAAGSEVPTTPEPPPWPERDAVGEAPAGPPPSTAEASPPPAAAPERPVEIAAHSVPATPVGESTRCPRCGTENRPGIAFCRTCGQRLVAAGTAATVQRPSVPEGTQQCPRCGTHNRAGVAFCQNCGANLRVAATPAPGYVPPAASATAGAGGSSDMQAARGGALLGPIVLLIGAIGLVTAWLLPFAYGFGSLWDRSFGVAGGYGIAFWDGYGAVGNDIVGQAYFGFAAPAPLLVLLLVALAIGGFLRAGPGALQRTGLVIALIWSLGLVVFFVLVEVIGGWNGDLVGLLRSMTPGGIIFFLASLIVIIGGLTRLGRA